LWGASFSLERLRLNCPQPTSRPRAPAAEQSPGSAVERYELVQHRPITTALEITVREWCTLRDTALEAKRTCDRLSIDACFPPLRAPRSLTRLVSFPLRQVQHSNQRRPPLVAGLWATRHVRRAGSGVARRGSHEVHTHGQATSLGERPPAPSCPRRRGAQPRPCRFFRWHLRLRGRTHRARPAPHPWTGLAPVLVPNPLDVPRRDARTVMPACARRCPLTPLGCSPRARRVQQLPPLRFPRRGLAIHPRGPTSGSLCPASSRNTGSWPVRAEPTRSSVRATVTWARWLAHREPWSGSCQEPVSAKPATHAVCLARVVVDELVVSNDVPGAARCGGDRCPARRCALRGSSTTRPAPTRLHRAAQPPVPRS